MARVTLLLAALLAALPAGPGAAEPAVEEKAAEPAPAGTWKVILPLVGEEEAGQPRWLVRFDKSGDGWTGTVLASARQWPKATVENLQVESGRLRFLLKTVTLTLACDVKLPKEAAGPKLYGAALLRKRATPLELERTTLTSLDPFAQAREMFGKQPLGHEAVQMAMSLLGKAEAQKLPPEEVRAAAEKAVRSATLYGPGWQRDVLLAVASVLVDQKGSEAIALQYARRAEGLLEDREPASTHKRVLEVLAAALEKAGKADEAKRVQARLSKLDFRIKPRPFAGRKGKSDRAVLVELFTGAQCPPCVAADLAFDAVAKSYKPTEVVLVQYHMHVPGPDPLTSPDGEGRVEFYSNVIRAAPTILFDGRQAAPGGGGSDDAIDKYDEYVDVLAALLEAPAKATVQVSAARKGDKVEIAAEVGKLDETGEDVRLRLLLVEKEVAYKGTNGIAVHSHVVRAMPAGVYGVALTDKSYKKTFTVNLDELRKQLKEYLDKYQEKRPFPTKERPMELKELAVVAFVQSDKTGAVLQSVWADVKGQ
ncbi:MAG: hypothetical protein U0736_23900 [Gemmataceae bacterium]